MNWSAFLKRPQWMLLFSSALMFANVPADARSFVVSGSTLNLVDVTSNVDVYYTAMRYNRAANEWDVNVTLSNKVTQAEPGPMLLVVDSFTGTSGPLRTDGTSSNQLYFDFTPELLQGQLAPQQVSMPRVLSFGYTPGASPKLTTSIFALAATNTSQAVAFTQSEDQVGAPLPGVFVVETGPGGITNYTTDPAFGIVTLGTVSGDYTWMFSSNGYLPVWRQALLVSNVVTVLPYPRLVAVNPPTNTVSPLAGAGLTNQSFQAQFSAGAFSQNSSVQIESLDGQTLPFPLPQGWSPLQAFAIQFSSEPTKPLTIQVNPWGPVGLTEQAAFVEFNSATLTWQTLQLIPGSGTNALTVNLPGSGTYALVVGDGAPIAPPAASAGTPLQASAFTVPNATNITAASVVTPTTSPASTVPESVTAIAQVTVTNLANPLPSGLWFRGEITETFDLFDGTLRTPQIFDTYFTGYQRPASAGLGILQAQFPVRPELIFGPTQLNQGDVHIDVFAADAFSGSVFDTNGGLIGADPVRLLAGAGVFSRPEGIELRAVNPTNFSSLPGSNFTVASAFETAVAGINSGSQLSLQVSDVASNATFVLGQVVDQGLLYGVAPLARMHSDTNGNLINDETNAIRLPGITGSGQFVLLQIPFAEGLIAGIAENSSAQPAAGLPVSVPGLPWVTISGEGGSFQILVPMGSNTISVSNTVTGDAGMIGINMPNNLPNLQTTVGTGADLLTVTSITPSDGESNVAQVTPIVINFSRPIDDLSFDTNSVILIENTNSTVAATANLSLSGTTVTLLTVDQLDAGAQYQVVLSTNLTDTDGRPIAGQTTFAFNTAPAATRDPAAQLIIYQPGATNLDKSMLAELPGYVMGSNSSQVVVQGTPGCADPDVPVVIMNEGTGATTTVTSQDDGSFLSFVAGQEQDFISATFFSQNGTRLYVPVNRQIYDDGSVGLYQQGGSLTASGDGGPITVTIPANAIQTRTIFKLNSITPDELQTQLAGVTPTNATVAGSALNLTITGQTPTLPLQASFPVDLTSLGYPTNEAPTNAAAMLAIVQSNQNVTSFQCVDQLLFTPQAASQSAPLVHNLLRSNVKPKDYGQVASGFLNTSVNGAVGALGLPGLAAQIAFNQVLVPLLFGPRPVTVKGKVGAIPYALAVALQNAGLLAQIISLQTGVSSIDVPFTIAQQVGFVNLGLPVSLVQQAVAVNYQVFQLAVEQSSQPLSGAFITLTLSGGPLVQEPGRLYPGMVYATSGSDGTFLMVAPAAGANYLVTASHPLYAGSQTQDVNPISTIPGQMGDLSLSGVVYKNFFFTTPAIEQTTPVVSIANTPVLPGAGVPCQVVVSATGVTGPPRIGVGPAVGGTTNILTGQLEAAPAQVSLTSVVITTNGNTTQWTGTLNCDEAVAVTFKVVVMPPVGTGTTIPYQVSFSGPVPVTPITTIPAPDTNDVHGPLVVSTSPTGNGYVDNSDTVTVTFNKPIDAFVTNHLDGITLGTGNSSAGAIIPVVRLSADQQILSLEFPGLLQGATYHLTLSGQSIRDLSGRPLDQIPSTPVADSFTMTFRTETAVTAPLPGLVNGRGTVISGNQFYAIDQAPQGNYLDAFDISNPQAPKLESQLSLFGAPRDLVLIPKYRYQLNVQSTIQTNDLIAVVGGNLDAQLNDAQGETVTEPGQYLWVVNMGNPSSPIILASPIVSYRDGSAVTKVRWAPPYLAYEEFGSDIQLIGLVNLQELIIGYNSSLLQQEAFGFGRAGVDLLGDGTYVDPGDKLPLPPSYPATFYGNDQNYVIQGSTQKILDFSVTPGARTVGVTLEAGKTNNAQGAAVGPLLPPMYRTLAYNGVPLNNAVPTNAGYLLPGAYPRWVTVFDVLPILSNGAPTTIAAALVSLAPDADGSQELAVLNISIPGQPQLVNKIAIPSSVLGGDIGAISQRADGLLEVAGQQNVVVLNPLYLGIPANPGQLSQAIVDVIPNAGTGMRSWGTTTYGVQSVADNGRSVVIESPPQLQFVSFPGVSLFDPSALSQQTDAAIAHLFTSQNALSALAPASISDLVVGSNTLTHSDLTPPNPSLHYYVLMYAPGGSGAEIDLGLESLSPVGRPLCNLSYGFAPVRAESTNTQQLLSQMPLACGAPIRALPSYRLSSNPSSKYYNYYLSRPFALVTASIGTADLTSLQTSPGVPREILFSGAQLRAFLEPDQSTNQVLGPFASQIDPNAMIVYPLASVTAPTVNRDYLIGANPPAPGGSIPFEDTYGTIQAHSGELRTSDADMALPSPRMPINFTRTIGNQDSYNGPFGVGWDFNYNQRLTILDPLTFPAGLQMPLVIRDTAGDSDIAGSQDILFNNGSGQIFHFIWEGTNMPSGYQQDPLVQAFDYADLVSDYYLPQRGSFDLLVKYKDGRFERLTPDGLRYRYSPAGRLEYVFDRYPQNWQYLTYDRNGSLIRIDDNSVTSSRYIQIGLYRLSAAVDPDFNPAIDVVTSNPYLVGKIYQLVDYTGRNVLFSYDPQGFLIEKDGIQVDGENGGYAGRNHTYYTWQNCKLAGVSATAAGIPYVNANNAFNTNGQPVATETTGAAGTNQFTVALNNTAANNATEQTGVKMPDRTAIQHTFDQWGYPSSTMITGTNGVPATEFRSNTADGLNWFIQHPEGNSETMTYDTNNAIFRCHGNLLTTVAKTGPRGGSGYTETFNYDPRYNLQSGAQVTADNFRVTYTLTGDGRAVESIDYGTAGTTSMTYNDNGQLTQTVDENGIVKGTTYDSSTGFVTTQTAGGIDYTYSYDGSIPSQLGKPASIASPTGTPTTFLYNNSLQTVEMDRGSLIATTAYDELGRSIYAQTQLGDGTEWTRTWAYDTKSFVTNTVLSGVEVNGAATSLSTTYIPDAQQRVQTIIDPNGTVQTYQYDARGNVLETVMGDYTNEFTYDLNNNPTTESHQGQLIRTVQYDGLDHGTNVIYHDESGDYSDSKTFYAGGAVASDSLVDPNYGTVRSYTYDKIDALGRHLTVTIHGSTLSPEYLSSYSPLSTTVTGPLMTYTTTYDTAGNEVGYTDPNETMVLMRDANDRVQQVDHHQTGATYTQYFTYDGLDHETSLGDLVGTRFNYVPRADGKIIKTTDAATNSVTQTYTSLGELTSRIRADGMQVDYRHDLERHVVYQGDPGAGFNYGFDNDQRMTNNTLRNGNTTTYSGFDENNNPTQMALPGGGTATLQYDLQKRLTQRKVSYQNTAWEEDFTYDAVGRVRGETYIQNGGAKNTATFDFDPAGPLLAAHFNEDNATYNVGYTYYTDGTLSILKYPSGVSVKEYRDSTGRLTGLSDANGNIISAVSWQGTDEPSVVQLGSNLMVTNQFDKRGRLTASRVSRTTDGAVLTHMRYQYDGANNVQIRQFLHRGGISDFFGYDAGERLSQAQVGVEVTNTAGSGPALYERDYNYHQSGLDYLTTVSLIGSLSNAPPFGSNWPSHDDFLQPTFLDGFNRGQADPMGNVSGALLWVRPSGAAGPQPVAAAFQHDGLGHLVTETLTNGIVVQNEFQPGDLRFGRTVLQHGVVASSSGYVYDNQSRLLEEYDRTGAKPVLIGRYYYANGDSPVAADLLNAGTGQLQRYYYLKDDSQSIIAVVDTNGNNVERVWYDPFGQPYITAPNGKAPVVTSVQAGAGGSLLIAMSEPVESPFTDPGAGSGIVAANNTIPQSISAVDATTSNAIPGTVTLLPTLPGFAPLSVLQFTPNTPTTNPITLTLVAGTLADEWDNSNLTWSVTFTNSQPQGAVYYQSGTGATSTQMARSSVGSPFLFQGQYCDYDTGLLYLRARFYDSFAGMFMEPDPLGYSDSVNHYAGFGNNPVKLRDPSGLAWSREYEAHLQSRGVHPMVIEMAREFAPQAARVGIAANELVTMLQGPLLKAIAENTPMEIYFRSFKNNEVRVMNAEMGFQGKPIYIYLKTDPISGLTRASGRWGEHPFNSDIDFVMVTVRGEPTEIGEFNRFADSLNQTHLELNPGFLEARSAAGLDNVEGEPQLMVMHGATLYLPFERAQSALRGSPESVTAIYKDIVKKMPNGIGECASIGFDPQKGLYANENVNISDVTARSAAMAHDVLMNPNSPRYDPQLARGFRQAAAWEHDASGLLLPSTLMRSISGGMK